MSALLAAGLAGVAAALAVRPGTPLPRRVQPAPSRRGSAEDADDVPARAAVVVGLATALVSGLLLPGWSALLAVPLGVLGARHTSRLESRAARRRRERLEAELPHLVDLVRALVAAGSAPDLALRSAAGVVSRDTAGELRPWLGRLTLGSDPFEVWAEIARHPQLGRLGATLHRAAASGAPVGEALQRLSHDLRAVRRAEIHRRVREVEVRATAPLGACLLPAFVLVGVVPLVAGVAQGLVLPG